MTTEREILEYAAKACGIDGVWQEGFGMCLIGEYLKNPGETPRFWNPKDNSADCAAMCAKMDINTFFYLSFPRVECYSEDTGDDQVVRHSHGHNGTDTYKETAWRYAATMVAAKIGGMK